MIGQAHFAAKQLAQMGNGAQMSVFRCGRIGAGAFQQHDIARAGVTRGLDVAIDLTLMLRGNDRADLRLWVQRIAERHLTRERDDALDELGQTDEVLRTLLGYSEAHISALKEGQVI